ncbi:MAG: excinuclease ABC subunit C [Bacteroidetes bacterium]|nr:MAG: excinuclease ABC subunit C [Bacteroidota bacterium]TAG89070.1 MAG: excinuclease ABC subunit C [Bacteroidota bacterium]
MENKELTAKETALLLPQDAGVYRFFNKEKVLLYVGKAKHLRNRVTSYFNASKQHNRKTLNLIRQIDKIEYTIVSSEYDALLLENSLIKEYQPKYNILLKDGKSYPYILLTNERFPRVIVTRQVDKTKGTYFGPFSNNKSMQTILDLIKELYPLRNCLLSLSKENIEGNKFKVCLEYHLKNCLGPCENHQTEADYNEKIAQVRQILGGNLTYAKQYFKEKMQKFADEWEFEQAETCKQKLTRVEQYQSRSLIVNPNITEIDVLTLTSDEEICYLNFIKIKNGAIIHTKNIEIKKKLDETNEEILEMVLVNLHTENETDNKEVITNLPLTENLFPNLINTIPKIGDKKKLLDLSMKNALMFKKDQRQKVENGLSEEKINKAVLDLQKCLNLSKPPIHIECFDNSNIQGTNPVAAMVYFKDGKPLKKEYRHYNVKTVIGPDDFASMREIVKRRYQRLLDEDTELPDLIIIDGGKGQLSSACDSLKELDLFGKIPIIGIAKRLEEIYFPDDDVPLHLSKKSLSLQLIQRARDEAHRFGLTFHRLKRSNDTNLKSSLEQIEGIGEKTMATLIKEFKSLKNIRTQSEEELAKIVGQAKAKILKEAFEKMVKIEDEK